MREDGELKEGDSRGVFERFVKIGEVMIPAPLPESRTQRAAFGSLLYFDFLCLRSIKRRMMGFVLRFTYTECSCGC